MSGHSTYLVVILWRKSQFSRQWPVELEIDASTCKFNDYAAVPSEGESGSEGTRGGVINAVYATRAEQLACRFTYFGAPFQFPGNAYM